MEFCITDGGSSAEFCITGGVQPLTYADSYCQNSSRGGIRVVTVLQEINARSSRDQSTANLIAATLATLESEIDARMSDDTRLLEASPSLDALHRLTEIWTEIRDSLSASTRDFGSGEELDFFQTEDALWRSPSASAEGRITSV